MGGVILENEGEEVTIREDMQLRNGNTLTTGEDGSVDLNLDDTKAAGLDVSSRAAFEQNGKALTINVESGALYFYTTEELEDDESMDIVTQTMMVGLRGTSGYVIYNPKNDPISCSFSVVFPLFTFSADFFIRSNILFIVSA